jgi:serine/threonine-protein kinase
MPTVDALRSDIKEIGEYEILRKLGEGGMGMVFLARQKSLDRTVALKVLSPKVAKDQKFTERFQREARASGKLEHPHIVQGIDVGQDPKTGLWHFAMEFVNGPSVSRLLKSGVVPERRALQIVRQIASALECADKRGFIHRDIKPDNILLTAGGDAKLADLGLAKKTEENGLTQMGQVVGTPHYISPEQARGESHLDIRTDIYSLGATLFHMVTGKVPYDGANPAIIAVRHIQDPIPVASKINPAVSEACTQLILRMMAKDRNERIKSPSDLCRLVDIILAKQGGSSRKLEPVAPAKSKRETKRKKDDGISNGLLIAAGVVLLMLVGAIIYSTSGSPPPVPQTPPKAAQRK